jgi:hypothetical protein
MSAEEQSTSEAQQERQTYNLSRRTAWVASGWLNLVTAGDDSQLLILPAVDRFLVLFDQAKRTTINVFEQPKLVEPAFGQAGIQSS